MLIELDLLRCIGIQHGDAGATVIEEQIFILVKNTSQNGHVDVLTVEVRVALLTGIVTGLQNNIYGLTQWLDHIHEQLKKLVF